jgi:2-polyprenyl-3-methyl-5-hydroxy-6-metoxy-1,4-benzoquinol methylase
MANKNGKEVDTTFLSIDQAEARGFIHRDYIAHCFRWSHVIKFLSGKQRYKTARILDVGCGRLIPMGTMLHSSRMAPEYYCGVDFGPVDRSNKSVATTLKSAAFNCDILDHTDASTIELDDGEEPFNIVTCFEMLEHVEPSMVLDTFQMIKRVTTPDADIFISTPCFNGKAAANHVNEMTYEALAAVFNQEGFYLHAEFGTFASIRDYEMDLSKEERVVFNMMRDYYDVNILATFFAPMHASKSRNVLWHLKPGDHEGCNNGVLWSDAKEPWSSSDKWKELKR